MSIIENNFQDIQSDIDEFCVNETVESDLNFNENEVYIDDDISNDLNLEKPNKESHLLFTNILNNKNIQQNREDYLKWLNNNYEELKNAYFMLYSKYFNLSSFNIKFKDFTEFCFLYY